MDAEPQNIVSDSLTPPSPPGFSLERLLSHVDPGPREESEEFVRGIYERRRDPVERDEPFGS